MGWSVSEEFWSTYSQVMLFILALIAWVSVTMHFLGRGEDARSMWGCVAWRLTAMFWFAAGVSALLTLGMMNE